MKVSECERCEYHQRKTWSHVHYPANFHAIGMSHAYAYCKLHNERCSAIKKCGMKCPMCSSVNIIRYISQCRCEEPWNYLCNDCRAIFQRDDKK